MKLWKILTVIISTYTQSCAIRGNAMKCQELPWKAILYKLKTIEFSLNTILQIALIKIWLSSLIFVF